MSKDIDFDDFEDFDFDDLDMDSFGVESQEDDRNPVVRTAKQVGRTVYAEGTALDKNLDAVKDALPSGLRRTVDVADELKDSGSRLYSKAMDNLYPTMRDLSITTRRITPRLRRVLPESLVDKVDGWLDGVIENDPSHSGHPTKEEIDNQVIVGKLEDIFKKQLEVESEVRSEDKVEKYVDDQIQKGRHEETKSLQGRLVQLASDEADYRNSVTWRYQKEMLEVNYRQWFAQRDLLENFLQFAAKADESLGAITKNTALPEATKIQLSEQYKLYAQEALFGKAHSALAGRASGFFNRVTNKASEKVEEFVEGLKGNLSTANQAMEMITGQLEAQEQMGDNSGVTGMIMDGAVGKLGDLIRQELGKRLRTVLNENETIALWNAKASRFMNNADEIFQGFMDEDDDGTNWDYIRKFMRFVDDEREDSVDVTHNLVGKATEPVAWDVLQRRYITEVYPEYYSRMLQQLEIIASGNQDVERLVYSTKREAMVGRSMAVADAKDDVYSDEQFNRLSNSIREFIENVDDENRLSTDARALLGRTILNEVRNNRTFNPVKFAENRAYWDDKAGDDVKSELSSYISRKYKVVEGEGETDKNAIVLSNQAMNRAKNIKSSLFDAQTPINQYNALSQKALLRDAGVIAHDKHGVDKFVEDNFKARAQRALEVAVAEARENIIKEGLESRGMEVGDLGPQPTPEMMRAMTKDRVDATTPFKRGGIENEYRAKPITEARTTSTTTAGTVGVTKLDFPKSYPLPETQMQRLVKSLGGKDITVSRDELKELQFIRTNTDTLPELMKYLKEHSLVADGDGVVKKGLAGLVSGLWGGIKATGRGFANTGRFGLDTVGGIRDVIFGALGGQSNIDDDQKDLYVKGGWRPRLTAARLAAGEYFDETTGEVIKSWKDIKGAVKDAKGNIVLSLEDFKKGFRDQAGKDMLVNVTRTVLSAPFKAMGALAQLPATLISLPGKAWGGITDYYNARKDVYSADGKLLLYFHRMRAGEYFDKETGKVIRSVEDIKGEVVEYNGNGEPVVVVSMDDLDKGPLCDRNGKPIRTLNLKNLVLGTAGVGAKVISAVAKTAWNVGSTVITDSYKAGTTGIKTLWNKLFGGGGLTGNAVNFNDIINVAEMYVKAGNVYINGTPISNTDTKEALDKSVTDEETKEHATNTPTPGAETFNKADKFDAFEQAVNERKKAEQTKTEKETVSTEEVVSDGDDKFKFKVKAYLSKLEKSWQDETPLRDKLQAWLIKWTDLTEADLAPLNDLQIRKTFDHYYESVKQKGGEHYEMAKAFKDRYVEEFKSGERTVASTVVDGVTELKDKTVTLKDKVKTSLKERSEQVSDTVYQQAVYKDTETGEARNAVDDVVRLAGSTKDRFYKMTRRALGKGPLDEARYRALRDYHEEHAGEFEEGTDTLRSKMDRWYNDVLQEAKLQAKLFKGGEDIETRYQKARAQAENPEAMEAPSSLKEKTMSLRERIGALLHREKDEADVPTDTESLLTAILGSIDKDSWESSDKSQAAFMSAIKDDALHQTLTENAETRDELYEAMTKQLEDNQDVANEQLSEAQEQTEVLRTVAERIQGVKESLKPETVAGDFSGDGIRNNSWQDILRRRKEKQAAEAEKPSEERSKDNQEKSSRGLNLTAILAGLAGIKGAVVSGFTTLAALFGAKKVADVAGDAIGGVGTDGTDNKRNRRNRTGRKRPGVLRSLGRGALGVAGWGLRGVLGLTAKLVIGSVGVLTSAPVLGVAAAAGVGYGVYKGAQYLGRRAMVQPLEGLRFMQYGIDPENDDAVIAIRYFEREIIGAVRYNQYGVAEMPVNLERWYEKYHKDFGRDLTQDDFLEWRSWYIQRFLPVFLTNCSHTRMISRGHNDARTTFTLGNINLIDVDDEMRDDRKAEFIANTVYTRERTEGGVYPYDVLASPFKPPITMVTDNGVHTEAEKLKHRFSPDAETLKQRQIEAANRESKALEVMYGGTRKEEDRRLTAMAELAQKNNLTRTSRPPMSDAAQRALELYGKNTAAGMSVHSRAQEKEGDVVVVSPSMEQKPDLPALVTLTSAVEQQGKAANDDRVLGDYILPTEGRVSSPFGTRVHPTRGTVHTHSGIDIAAPEGTPVVAAQVGVVTRRAYSSSYGNVVYVDHPDGTQTRYAHLSGFAYGLRLGNEVQQGELLGFVGSTGVSTGPHLHYQHKRGQTQASPNVNPLDAMGEFGKELNRKDVMLTRPAVLESDSDIDPEIEGEYTLPAGSERDIASSGERLTKQEATDNLTLPNTDASRSNILSMPRPYTSAPLVRREPMIQPNPGYENIGQKAAPPVVNVDVNNDAIADSLQHSNQEVVQALNAIKDLLEKQDKVEKERVVTSPKTPGQETEVEQLQRRLDQTKLAVERQAQHNQGSRTPRDSDVPLFNYR